MNNIENIYDLPDLISKEEIDYVINYTEDKLVVLRFGKNNNLPTIQLDKLLNKCCGILANMADFYIVDTEQVRQYTEYFRVTTIPSLIFYFNGNHIRIESGSGDHTKWIGTFQQKQDLIDVIETLCTGALSGKYLVQSPVKQQLLNENN
eukprot:TRINITY_DN6304_c0_g1_i1.p1 TRINITY_DN6304_c0_g1~~TRINITY_DN6304_c0_g1_i1.p1  ORF type:complete len:149 (+),score=22.64 TRINITY_DN6304_c0_g1_i1:240-686(+)